MKFLGILTGIPLALALAFGATPAAAQEPAASPAATVAAPATAAPAATASEAATPAADGAVGGYTPMKPTEGIGMPVQGEWNIQPQFSPIGHTAFALHTALIWIMIAISVFVLALMLYTLVRFRRKANPVPSRTSHNTLVEVIWTVVPALILLGIAIPSISLLAKQYKAPPADAITVKATGYQWYWGYSYPDNGDFEVISNMLDEDEAAKRGEPHQLAVDNRMVVPAGVPIRFQTTGADVIHSFAVPSLWFKLDAVPGRLNEKVLFIEKPGVYYGQCSELCGARHGYMPIAVEALPMDQFNAWVVAQGGTVKGAKPAAAAAAPAAASPAPGDAPAPPVASPSPSAAATAAAAPAPAPAA